MEYGGITPIGLPADWPLLIDSAVVDLPYVLVGSGRRRGSCWCRARRSPSSREPWCWRDSGPPDQARAA